MSWGEEGPGTWITVYAHGGHAYVVIAGFRFDTSMRDADAPGPEHGPALEPDAAPLRGVRSASPRRLLTPRPDRAG